MHRVVITGLGIYSSIGKNLETVRNSLYEGKSGVIFDPERKAFGYRSGLTGYVDPPELKGRLDRRARMMMPEQCEYAYMSTVEAIEQAGLDEGYFQQHDVGLIFGNDSSSKAVIEGMDIIREKRDSMMVGSGSVFQTMNSTVNMNLATIFHLKGINYTISAACASGSHSIGTAYTFIKYGLQEMIICGGAQETNIYSMPNFDALAAFSICEQDPTRASRPFDRDRDGLVPSGGAATVILESLESAQRRGARIFGEILGFGFSSNGGHISNPTVDGPAKSIAMAMKNAGLQARDIDYINAHATSTPLGDAKEARAIYSVFGDHPIPVSSTKSMTGHECWMSGASEIVYSSLMMMHDFIAPNINFENPDEDSSKLNIIARTTDRKIDTYLSNSFGFGGTNSSIIVKRGSNL